MIVICPSCHRRYRHDFQVDVAQVAHCGACDERFEPVPPKRTYVLVPGGSVSPAAVSPAGIPPAAIGLHDPLLAGKLLDASMADTINAITQWGVGTEKLYAKFKS